jgi:hypothetical protein
MACGDDEQPSIRCWRAGRNGRVGAPSHLGPPVDRSPSRPIGPRQSGGAAPSAASFGFPPSVASRSS